TPSPTVTLDKTTKGWNLGPDFADRHATHQIKKMNKEELRVFRDRLYPHEQIPHEALDADMPPYYRPQEDSEEFEYMMERRQALDGSLPRRVVRNKHLELPEAKTFDEFRKGSGKQEVATTMAFVRVLRNLLKDENIGARIVPIIPDEARTFGM